MACLVHMNSYEGLNLKTLAARLKEKYNIELACEDIGKHNRNFLAPSSDGSLYMTKSLNDLRFHDAPPRDTWNFMSKSSSNLYTFINNAATTSVLIGQEDSPTISASSLTSVSSYPDSCATVKLNSTFCNDNNSNNDRENESGHGNSFIAVDTGFQRPKSVVPLPEISNKKWDRHFVPVVTEFQFDSIDQHHFKPIISGGQTTYEHDISDEDELFYDADDKPEPSQTLYYDTEVKEIAVDISLDGPDIALDYPENNNNDIVSAGSNTEMINVNSVMTEIDQMLQKKKRTHSLCEECIKAENSGCNIHGYEKMKRQSSLQRNMSRDEMNANYECIDETLVVAENSSNSSSQQFEEKKSDIIEKATWIVDISTTTGHDKNEDIVFKKKNIEADPYIDNVTTNHDEILHRDVKILTYVVLPPESKDVCEEREFKEFYERLTASHAKQYVCERFTEEEVILIGEKGTKHMPENHKISETCENDDIFDNTEIPENHEITDITENIGIIENMASSKIAVTTHGTSELQKNIETPSSIEFCAIEIRRNTETIPEEDFDSSYFMEDLAIELLSIEALSIITDTCDTNYIDRNVSISASGPIVVEDVLSERNMNDQFLEDMDNMLEYFSMCTEEELLNKDVGNKFVTKNDQGTSEGQVSSPNNSKIKHSLHG